MLIPRLNSLQNTEQLFPPHPEGWAEVQILIVFSSLRVKAVF